ncbi:MAG: helix-turn-helix domain-containing protein [Anaerolineales bacterium]|nr:helix-turn-helix domain-containing protein [Anaerolineales bacterium]
MSSEWMSLSEIAAELGVHPSTVRNWADQGRIPVHRTQGGHRRFKRSEIDLWSQSQQASLPDEASLVIQDAMKRTRMQISEGHLEAEAWYEKLDDEARAQYRKSGRGLLQGLMAYLSSDGLQAHAEARALGFEYASRGRRYGLSVLDATQAFLFFRNNLMDAMLSVYEDAAVRSSVVWIDMFRKIGGFTDRIMLTLLETYEAFERGNRG